MTLQKGEASRLSPVETRELKADHSFLAQTWLFMEQQRAGLRQFGRFLMPASLRASGLIGPATACVPAAFARNR